MRAFCGAVSEALPHNSVFGRLGGEEFAILLTGFGLMEAERLLASLRVTVSGMSIRSTDGRALRITFSGGYVAFGADENDMDRIFSAADRALYAAKNSGRNRVFAFDTDLFASQDVRYLRDVAAANASPVQARA